LAASKNLKELYLPFRAHIGVWQKSGFSASMKLCVRQLTDSVLADSLVLINLLLRQAPNRQAVKKPNSNLFLQKNTPTIFLDFTSACLP